MNLSILVHYATGIRDMDSEHKSLFVLMNSIDEMCHTHNKERILEELVVLKKLLLEHCEHEEYLMECMHFPYITYHKQQHKDIQVKLAKLVDDFSKSTFFYARATSITSSFSESFLKHVDESDSQYSSWYKKMQGVACIS